MFSTFISTFMYYMVIFLGARFYLIYWNFIFLISPGQYLGHSKCYTNLNYICPRKKRRIYGGYSSQRMPDKNKTGEHESSTGVREWLPVIVTFITTSCSRGISPMQYFFFPKFRLHLSPRSPSAWQLPISWEKAFPKAEYKKRRKAGMAWGRGEGEELRQSIFPMIREHRGETWSNVF